MSLDIGSTLHLERLIKDNSHEILTQDANPLNSKALEICQKL